jgi:phosphoserine phosphatase
MQGLHDLFAATHAGMIQEEFETIVHDWFASAKHPTFARPFTAVTFQPQVGLLTYLRAHGFRTFIVSGGGVDFMRVTAEVAYGVAREHVVGSSGKLRADLRDGRMVLMKLPETNSFDDREAKVQNIGLQIGRRPILACGNSDGDLAMLRYAKTGPGLRLSLVIHHGDSAREVVYDREFRLSPLVEALDKADEYGITVVSMRRDWKTVFPKTGDRDHSHLLSPVHLLAMAVMNQ